MPALARCLEHTAGIYGFIAALHWAVRAAGPAWQVCWWATGSAAERRYQEERWHHLHPHAAGACQAGPQRVDWWLEWDRATVSPGRLAAKLEAYRTYVRSRRWAVDGRTQLPRLLIVSASAARTQTAGGVFSG
jgi:hypothetical protein